MAADTFPYPRSPEAVPDGLTDFPATYTSRQYTLVVSLFVFLLIYCGLVFVAGLATAAGVMLTPAAPVVGVPIAVASGLVFVFLVKGLLKRGTAEKDMHVEITEGEHPKLFGFIRKLCDEVGTEEPNRVFVSPDVNAAVITRTSLVNVVVRPKRDLLIGLGLVNSLNLSEFKAALAHEFGHFSQGGWANAYFNVVYRVCYDIVVGRDWFDNAIEGLKKSGGGGLLVGGTVGGCLGAMRWCLDKTFGLIAFQRHSVLQEQEYHADLVAASLAGSNAITHCLYRLGFASESFGQALADLRKAADHKLYSADLYYHHHAAGDILRRQKRDPHLGKPPALKAPKDGARVQVFDPEKETDPRDEGDYHPPNHEREENVKERFVAAPEDTRSAWVLFTDPADLRERMTYKMYRMGLKIPKNSELADPAEVQKFIDDEHAETTYDPKYEGVYDERMINPGDLEELNQTIGSDPWDDARLAEVYAKLYANLKGKADERKELSADLDKVLSESGGAKSKKTKRIVKELEAQLEEFDKWFDSLDRRAYLVFIQMAFHVGQAEFDELRERYRFHLAVQGVYKTARDEKRKAHFFASVAFSKGELAPDDFAETMHVLRGARKSLKKILREADEIDMPAMANFVKGEKLGTFLLDVELVKEFPEHFIKGKQIGKLLDQLDTVQARAARLHFKSLGGILALQERVAAAFLAARGLAPKAAG